jgi:hypothetical protein
MMAPEQVGRTSGDDTERSNDLVGLTACGRYGTKIVMELYENNLPV